MGFFLYHKVTGSFLGLAAKIPIQGGRRLPTAFQLAPKASCELSTLTPSVSPSAEKITGRDPFSAGVCLLLGPLGPPYLGTDVLKGGRAHQGEADQKDILQREGQTELTKGCPSSMCLLPIQDPPSSAFLPPTV